MAIPDRIHDEFILIKGAFENGSITKMSQLEKQKPTRIASLMGMNQGRYGAKLFAPWEFSTSEIIRFALIINIDPSFVINVIKNEILDQELPRIVKNIDRVEKRKKRPVKK